VILAEDIGTFKCLTQETFQSGVSADKTKKAVQIFIELYKNPLIWAQELTANAYDAHVETGQTKPVVVSMTSDQCIISDFGPGLSPDRIMKMYTFLESTKEATNDQIGGWGLGSKSVFAYTEQIIVETVFDGTFYRYLIVFKKTHIAIYEMFQESTDKVNQTHIIVDYKPDDKQSLIRTFAHKTCYIKNIVYEGLLEHLNAIKIQDFGAFYLSSTIDQDHLVIGNIPYEIDHSLARISKTGMSIGLRFDIGEIIPLPTRESVKFTDDVVERIKERYDHAKAIVSKFYIEQSVTFDNVFDYLKYNFSPYLIKINGEEYRWYNMQRKVEYTWKDLSHKITNVAGVKTHKDYKKFIYKDVPLKKANIGYLNTHYGDYGLVSIKDKDHPAAYPKDVLRLSEIEVPVQAKVKVEKRDLLLYPEYGRSRLITESELKTLFKERRTLIVPFKHLRERYPNMLKIYGLKQEHYDLYKDYGYNYDEYINRRSTINRQYRYANNQKPPSRFLKWCKWERIEPKKIDRFTIKKSFNKVEQYERLFSLVPDSDLDLKRNIYVRIIHEWEAYCVAGFQLHLMRCNARASESHCNTDGLYSDSELSDELVRGRIDFSRDNRDND